MSLTKIPLSLQVITAILLAIVLGSLLPASHWLFSLLDLIGQMFINALKMLVVPLVVTSMIMGVVNIGSPERLGKLGGKTALYYFFTTSLAVMTGLAFANLFQPGLINGQPAQAVLNLPLESDSAVIDRVSSGELSDFFDIFLKLIPPNIIDAAAQGQMLGLIFFSLLFGYFLLKMTHPAGDTLKQGIHGVFEVMMGITHIIMRLAPIGVFALVSTVVAESGIAVFQNLFWFVVTVLASLSFHIFITLPLVLALLAKVNPVKHYAAMLPAILTAFSTSSSAATLPITLESIEKNAGVSNQTASFVLPLGATINMDGTALYECVAVLFIAQALGLELTFLQQGLIVLLALLTSIGVAAVPSASLVAIVVIIGALGLPAEAIVLILATDRFLDMFRTAVNVFSDSCGAVVIARSEGEVTKVAFATTPGFNKK